MSNNILINASGNNIITDGEYLIESFGLFGADATGQGTIYIDGVFGAATVTLGWVSRGIFYTHKLSDGVTVAAFTAFTAKQMRTGTDNRLAIKVLGMDGATDILVTATPIN